MLVALLVLAAIARVPIAEAGGSVTCTMGTISYDKSHHDATLLENDGSDSVTVYFTVGDTLESSITKGELIFKDSNGTTIEDITHTVVAGDLTTTAEHSSVNNGVVAWNPTTGDGKLSFKFMHQFVNADKAGAAWTAQGKGYDSIANTLCTASTLATPLSNYAVVTISACCYTPAGATGPTTWSGWAADPGAASTSTTFVKVDNTGTGHGFATFTFAALSVSSPRAATIATGQIAIAYGTGASPGATTFNGVVTNGDQALINPGGSSTWVEYTVTVPSAQAAGSYTSSWSATGPN
ncbi:MAG: hypothetical protein ACYDCK_08865 [Thermoplasmatota archaeon]